MTNDSNKFRQGNLFSILFKGALPLSIADCAARGGSVLIALLIARFFGPSSYGEYATAASICGLFMMITESGFEREFVRRGGVNKRDIPDGLILNLTAVGITSCIAYFSMILFLSFGLYSKNIVLLALLLGMALVSSRTQLPFRQLCLLLNRPHLTAMVQTSGTFTAVLLTVLIIHYKLGLISIVCSQLFVNCSVVILWLCWLPKDLISNVKGLEEVARFVKTSIPFALSNIIWIAYFNFDTFMLSLVRPQSEVGVYAGVYRIVGINYILGFAVVSVYVPILYKKYSSDMPGFSETALQLLKVMTVIGISFCIFLMLFSKYLILAIIGKSYASGVLIAQILSLAVLFRMVNFGLCEILTTSNRQIRRVQMETTMLAINVILNYFLIQKHGGVGAAIATVCAEIVLFSGCLLMSTKTNVLEANVSFQYKKRRIKE